MELNRRRSLATGLQALVGGLLAIAPGCGSNNPTTVDAPAVVPDGHATVDAPLATPDAPAGNFACLGAALPTTAVDPLAIAGTAKALNGLSTTNAAGVLVAAYKIGSGTVLTSATTPADGTFALSLTTNAMPIDGYVKATAQGQLDYYLFPGAPLAAAVSGALVLMLSSSSLATVETLASVTAAGNPGTVGLVGVIVHDCNGAAVAGATITLTEGGTEVGDMRYVAGSLPSSTATMTDSNGGAFIFNVPAGTATVSAHVGAMTLRTHSFAVTGGATHATLVVP